MKISNLLKVYVVSDKSGVLMVFMTKMDAYKFKVNYKDDCIISEVPLSDSSDLSPIDCAAQISSK